MSSDERAAEAQAAADVLIRREVAEQVGSKLTAQYEGLKVTISDGRYLPIIRSIRSYEQALQGNCELLGERVRSGAVSHTNASS